VDHNGGSTLGQESGVGEAQATPASSNERYLTIKADCVGHAC
jgi:hypothetical protein